MKVSIWISLFLVFCTVLSPAASLDTAKANSIRTLTLKGLQYAYALDFKNAGKMFDDAHAIEPLHPRPMLGRASMRFWRLMIQKDDTTYERLVDEADNIIDAGEKYLDRYDKDADIYTCLGTAYAYRAFAHARMKSYLKAAWDGKKSYDYFGNAIELDPHAYDAYAGQGIFHYFATFMPKALQWVVSVLGVPGDSERGLKEIRITADKGLYSNVESKFYLAELLPWYNEDFDSSEKILQELAQKYPGNSLFNFTLAVWEIRRNDIRSAKDLLVKLSAEEAPPIPALHEFVLYKLGECYYRLRDYRRAGDSYERFLKNYHDEIYVSTANYRIGVCREKMGERDEAQKYYKISANAKSRFGDDRYSTRKATAVLKFGTAPEDTLLLYGQNLFESGEYASAVTAFTKLLGISSASGIIHTEAMYGIGETYFRQEKFSDAVKYFQDVTAQRVPKSDEWLMPWSYYYGGLCYLKMKNTADAKKSLEKTGDYDDYDFETWLGYRTKMELTRLK